MKLSRDSKVVVTGGTGFLGRAITAALERRGVVPIVPRSRSVDFRVCDQARAYIADLRPDLVIQAAWTGGGIGFIRNHPA